VPGSEARGRVWSASPLSWYKTEITELHGGSGESRLRVPGVILDELEIERVFKRLTRLKTAVIDSSSIIYLQKSGLLESVAGAVRLLTIPQVVEETGIRDLPLQVVNAPTGTDHPDTDRLLFAAAAAMHKAMISEDRAILLKCRSEGIEYYNAYNMLIMLRLRGILAEAEFRVREEQLLSVAHYGKFVIDYVGALLHYMRKVL